MLRLTRSAVSDQDVVSEVGAIRDLRRSAHCQRNVRADGHSRRRGCFVVKQIVIDKTVARDIRDIDYGLDVVVLRTYFKSYIVNDWVRKRRMFFECRITATQCAG